MRTEYHNHLRDQHAVTPLSCHLCDYETYDEGSLKNHLKNHLKRTITQPPSKSDFKCRECEKTFNVQDCY